MMSKWSILHKKEIENLNPLLDLKSHNSKKLLIEPHIQISELEPIEKETHGELQKIKKETIAFMNQFPHIKDNLWPQWLPTSKTKEISFVPPI